MRQLRLISRAKSRIWLRRYIGVALIGSFIVTLSVLISNTIITTVNNNTIYDDLNQVPTSAVGLVLGTAPVLSNGSSNPYYDYRIEAAATLYHAGKVRGLLVSGDNSRRTYDEPTSMYLDLIAAGVPAQHITRDYAGFRTLDSVVRSQAVFQCPSVNCQRALFIADAHDIHAIAYVAQDVTGQAGMRTWLREVGARFLAMMDCYVWQREPRFYGPIEPLSLAKRNRRQ